MAKKKTVGRTATTTRAVDTASDMRAVESSADATYQPTYEEIAEAAYCRYLERGTRQGGHFEDWLEAERALRERR